MSQAIDLIILGGGCAGLSLAMRLALLKEACPQTLILENRTQYTNDRTWCFWHDPSLVIPPCVTNQWDRFSIKLENDIIIVECPTTPYQMIPADKFYHHALQIIADTPSLTLQKGFTITEEPYQASGLWHVTTPTGIVTAPKMGEALTKC